MNDVRSSQGNVYDDQNGWGGGTLLPVEGKHWILLSLFRRRPCSRFETIQ